MPLVYWRSGRLGGHTSLRLIVPMNENFERLWCQRVGNVSLVAVGGSILQYSGCALVNAANEGGTGGFGVDEAINHAGGPELKEARRAFLGIPTGTAKTTPSFQMKNVKWIIHAVGPVFRVPFGQNENSPAVQEMFALKDKQLESAYRSTLIQAEIHQASTVGFCLLSAGVFRGARPLSDIVATGVRSIVKYAQELRADSSLTELTFVAFTPDERAALLECRQLLVNERHQDPS